MLAAKDARAGETGVSSCLYLGIHLDVNGSVDRGLEKSDTPDLKPCFSGELPETGELRVLRRFGLWVASWRQFFADPLGLTYCSARHVY